MSTATIDAHVRGYAEAVRLHLADLGPDVVDELSDGLEADLTEALADRSVVGSDDEAPLNLAAVFGPSQAYAAELRAAAGLPAATAAPRIRVRRRDRLAAWWSNLWAPLTTSPGWVRLRADLADLAPVWWVARGWLVGAFLAGWAAGGGWSLVPFRSAEWLWFAVAVVLSVQWGRGRWMPWNGIRLLAGAFTVVALIGVAPMTAATIEDQHTRMRASEATRTPQTGVFVDGQQVLNLFAYDAAGEPLKDVQLFDERGRPVQTVASDELGWHNFALGGDRWGAPIPALGDGGQPLWNVFPMTFYDELTTDASGQVVAAPGATQIPSRWPFRLAPALTVPGAEGEAKDGEQAALPQPEASPTPGVETPAETADDTPAETPADPADPASAPSDAQEQPAG